MDGGVKPPPTKLFCRVYDPVCRFLFVLVDEFSLVHSCLCLAVPPRHTQVYGLSTLPEAFSRMSAVHGGTFMLNKPVESFLYDEEGKVCGVKTTCGEVSQLNCESVFVCCFCEKHSFVCLTGGGYRCERSLIRLAFDYDVKQFCVSA